VTKDLTPLLSRTPIGRQACLKLELSHSKYDRSWWMALAIGWKDDTDEELELVADKAWCPSKPPPTLPPAKPLHNVCGTTQRLAIQIIYRINKGSRAPKPLNLKRLERTTE